MSYRECESANDVGARNADDIVESADLAALLDEVGRSFESTAVS